MSECPTCNKEFKSEIGVKTHHKQIHDESIRGVTLECSNCNKEYTRSKSHATGSKFCSRECQSEYKSSGESELICEECGDTYIVQTVRVEESKYCSNECQAKSKRLPYAQRNSQQWKTFSTKYRKWVGKCEECNYTENLHVHHDEPLFCGGDLWDNTFTVLCRECHLGDWENWH